MRLSKTVLSILSMCCLLFSSCKTGMLYINKTQPLSTNFDKTKAGGIKIKVTGSEYLRWNNVYIEWNTEELLNKIAHKHGLKELYYVDKKTFNILGFYNQKTYYFYGR